MSAAFFLWRFGAILALWRYAPEVDAHDAFLLRLTYNGYEASLRVSKVYLLRGPPQFKWESQARFGRRCWRYPRWRRTNEQF